MTNIRRICGFQNKVDVDSVGRSGGLSFGWKHNCIVSLHSFSRRHIDVLIIDDSEGNCWKCIGFYGAPKNKEESPRWWYFKFEVAWLLEDSCESEVNRIWVNSLGFVSDKLQVISERLNVWFRKIKRDKNLTELDLQKRLEKLNEITPTNELNTYLFFATVCYCFSAICAAVACSFRFAGGTGVDGQKVDFTSEEVTTVLHSMSPLKASGEDGLSVVFYQRFCHIMFRPTYKICEVERLFSTNVIEGNQSDVRRILRIANSDNLERYLDLPPMFGRNKKRAFSGISLYMRVQTRGWGTCYYADVEVLVSSIYRSSPPQAVCWSFPPISFVEINVDTVTYSVCGRSSSGGTWVKVCT
ncbi:hypothetical protein Gotur_031820 [Gossypium turneri]